MKSKNSQKMFLPGNNINKTKNLVFFLLIFKNAIENDIMKNERETDKTQFIRYVWM